MHHVKEHTYLYTLNPLWAFSDIYLLRNDYSKRNNWDKIGIIKMSNLYFLPPVIDINSVLRRLE